MRILTEHQLRKLLKVAYASGLKSGLETGIKIGREQPLILAGLKPDIDRIIEEAKN